MPTENDKTVFEAMCRLKCADRDTLCNDTGLARTSVYDALKRLERENAVVRFHPKNGRRGPKTIYVVNPQYGELSTAEWRRLQQTTQDLYRFFSDLSEDDRIQCQLSGEAERYGEVKDFCRGQCGIRIGCMEANQEE